MKGGLRYVVKDKVRGIRNAKYSFSTLSKSTSSKIVLSSDACELKGRRPYMEDRFIQSQDSKLAVVLDGHGGDSVSQIIKENFEKNFFSILATCKFPVSKTKIESAIKTTLLDIDTAISVDKALHSAGSTVALSYLQLDTLKPTIITANVGDSRVVLSRNNQAVDLTVDHKPDNPIEKERIEKLGGFIQQLGEDWYVNGLLAMSRAIGDYDLQPYVSKEIDFKQFIIQPEDQFIIVATDGLWDAFTSQQAVDYVHKKINECPDANDARMKDLLRESIVRELVRDSLRSGDNITAVIQWIDRD